MLLGAVYVIRLLPALKTVVIEGHTDAVGTDQYNEQLSQRRAFGWEIVAISGRTSGVNQAVAPSIAPKTVPNSSPSKTLFMLSSGLMASNCPIQRFPEIL